MDPSIFTQLPRAQEAFTESARQQESIDTTELLLAADRVIREAIAKGYMATGLGSIPDLALAEKAATQLHDLGYWTAVVGGGHAQQSDGIVRSLWVLQIAWRQMPSNTRDAFTI